jgi:S1-C subfamily serine protease
MCARFAAFVVLSGAVGNASADFPEIVERIKLSVVAIGTYEKTRNPQFAYLGTGFIVGDGTLVATNGHVLPDSLQRGNYESLIVIASPGRGEPRPRQASVQAVDKMHDLALLRISGDPLPAMVLHDAPPVREGQTFAFTGFPIGNVLGLSPVTHRGMISAITPIVLPGATAQQLNEKMIRSIKSGSFLVFQLDATAYPGNSGSPLYDIETGRVVGIINMVFVKGTRETVLSQPSGISFAIPVQFLQELLQRVR